MSDDELLITAASRADLVAEAAHELDSEMAHRRLSYQEARKETRGSSTGDQRSEKTPSIEEGIEVFRWEGEWMDAVVGGAWLASTGYRPDVLPSRPGRMALSHTLRLHRRSLCHCSGSALAEANVTFLDFACCFLRRAVACGPLAQRPSSAANEGRTKRSQGSHNRSRVRGGSAVISSLTEAGTGERP